MPANGFLSVHTYTSNAQLPVPGTTVLVTRRTSSGMQLVASRITDESGNITPIPIEAPAAAESKEPGNIMPWTPVDVIADHPNYERILVENVQIFDGITTTQNFELIPFAQLPEKWNMTEVFDISAQPL